MRRRGADAGTRTPDPFITSEVLYQLSYVGGPRESVAGSPSGELVRDLHEERLERELR